MTYLSGQGFLIHLQCLSPGFEVIQDLHLLAGGADLHAQTVFLFLKREKIALGSMQVRGLGLRFSQSSR